MKKNTNTYIRSAAFFLMLILTISSLVVSYASAQIIKENDPQLNKIDVIEHLGEYIPLDLSFKNDRGQEVLLGDYFSKNKPVILVMAYYECPMLCNLVLNGLSNGIHKLGWQPGENYQILTVSFDPTETPELAASKKKNYLASIDVNESSGWDFLVGEEEQSKKLAEALGFQYYYDESQEQYAHPAVIFLLSEDGKISRYLYGMDFPKKNLKLAILEAADGKVGTTIDRIILYCFHYDPNAGGYVVFAGNVMKLGGAITLLALLVLVAVLWSKEQYRKVQSQTVKL